MTPKEKAQELIEKMGFEVCKTDARKCALIAVDEILNVIVGTYDFDVLNQYWQEVKQEIENL